MRFDESRRLLARATSVIAGGVNSNVRLREQPHPLFFESADGPYLFDADGNRLVDYVLGNGPMLLGHRPRAVVEAVKQQLATGLLYAGQHRLETEVAELLVQHVPCAELVRFSQTGTEAVLAALRIARAASGRQKVLKFQGHYHGWADSMHHALAVPSEDTAYGHGLTPVEASVGQQHAIARDIEVATWNDLEGLRSAFSQHGHELAAVIAEPIMAHGCAAPSQEFLELLRDLCNRHSTVLIFDEVITGFRFGLGGAQSVFRVTPDLTVLGKAMASGFPVSAVVGRRALFDGVATAGFTHAGTYNGSPLGMAAAKASLTMLADPSEGVYDRIEETGSRLLRGLHEIAIRSSLPLLVQGFPSFFILGFTNANAIVDHYGLATLDLNRAKTFAREAVTHGVRPTGRLGWMLSAAHSVSDIDFTLEVCENTLRTLQN
jgi:glutamate-1-semialdehyde 2,1-aminomutase